MRRFLAIALLVAACGGATDAPASTPSAGVGLVGPSADATEEPLATEDLASENPVSPKPASLEPASPKPVTDPPDLPVKVTKAPGTVASGGTASATIKTTKKAICDIDVQYPSGSSTAKGLGPKTADSNGAVTWKWTVGSNTSKGTWPVTIRCALDERRGTAATTLRVK